MSDPLPEKKLPLKLYLYFRLSEFSLVLTQKITINYTNLILRA